MKYKKIEKQKNRHFKFNNDIFRIDYKDYYFTKYIPLVKKLERNVPTLKKIEEYIHNYMNCFNATISFNCNRNTFTYLNYHSDCQYYVKKLVKKNKKNNF